MAKIASPGAETVATDRLPQTPRAKKVIQSAIDEEGRLHQGYVGTEHLLLALATLDDGAAAHILSNLGIKRQAIRRSVLEILGHSADG